MRKLSTAFLIAGVAVIVALTGCGGGGGGGGTTDPPPAGTVTVTGRVINHLTGNGVPGIIIKFGTAKRTVATGADGTFSIDTLSTSVLAAYSGWTPWPPTFTVSTANKPQPPPLPGVTDWTPFYPATWTVTYDFYASTNGNYDQNAVPVPSEVLNGSANSLGTIVVYDLSDIPPIPF